MMYDALSMTFRTIRLQRDPSRTPVTELIDYDEFCGVVSDEASAAATGSTITAPELAQLIASGRGLQLVDVREPVEWDIMHLPDAVLVPKGRIVSGEALASLPQNKQIVLYCKTGIRSAEALAVVKSAGFADAVHLQGGAIAWAKQVDTSLPLY